MYKKLLRFVVVSLGFGSLALAQLPPVCDPCNCPDPSCYQCHTSCPTALAAVRNRQPKKPQPKKPASGLLVLASATPLAAGLLAIARLRMVRASQRMK